MDTCVYKKVAKFNIKHEVRSIKSCESIHSHVYHYLQCNKFDDHYNIGPLMYNEGASPNLAPPTTPHLATVHLSFSDFKFPDDKFFIFIFLF